MYSTHNEEKSVVAVTYIVTISKYQLIFCKRLPSKLFRRSFCD